jgi:anti-sigma B factor antagonist
MFNYSRFNENTAIIKTGKTLDNSNAHEMVQIISDVQEQDYTFIILDISELEFLSSAGVGSILGSIEISREAGGDIIVCNASEKIIHILDVLDLTDYLTIKTTEEEAKQLCTA